MTRLHMEWCAQCNKKTVVGLYCSFGLQIILSYEMTSGFLPVCSMSLSVLAPANMHGLNLLTFCSPIYKLWTRYSVCSSPSVKGATSFKGIYRGAAGIVFTEYLGLPLHILD